VCSQVSDLVLNDFKEQGFLPAQEIIGYRAPQAAENIPHPREGEVVIFTDHLLRGFSPPGSKFFWDVLHFFNLHPQDIGPNSVSNLCQFQVLCEVYLQMEATVPLFREFFYLNRQTECVDGPCLELGGVSIQRRRDVPFPSALLLSHPKGWNKTWFYCKNTAPADENPLPGYRVECLTPTFELPGWASQEEHAQVAHVYPKLRALLANGLTGVDLTRCWITWKILPLSRRDDLMCNYSGESTDPQRFSPIDMSADDINKAMKKLLGSLKKYATKHG
jgi:hypothetical protein